MALYLYRTYFKETDDGIRIDFVSFKDYSLFLSRFKGENA